MIKVLIIIMELSVIAIIGVMKEHLKEQILSTSSKSAVNKWDYDYLVPDDAQFDYEGQEGDSYDYE